MFFAGNTLRFKQCYSKWLIKLLLLLSTILNIKVQCDKLYDRPIIGIVPELLPDSSNSKTLRIISSSYAKFVEYAGARVVMLLPFEDREYYEKSLVLINGVLLAGRDYEDLTGESRVFFRENAVKHILDIAREMNDRKLHFPVMGIGLGFLEIINYFADQHSEDWLVKCDCNTFLSKVDTSLVTDLKSTQIFAEMDQFLPNITKILNENKIAMHQHHYCVDYFKWEQIPRLNNSLIKLSRTDYNFNSFVSLFEHIFYPFFGTAWQPERNQFEMDHDKEKGNHGIEAVSASQYFANFFVKEACKNKNYFYPLSNELTSLIYNLRTFIATWRNSFVYDLMYLWD